MGVGGVLVPPEATGRASRPSAPARYPLHLRRGDLRLRAHRPWFAAEHWTLSPDMLVTAKGMTSGYFPLGAVMIGERVLRLDGHAFPARLHLHGHPTGCAIALENLAIIEREGLVECAAQHGRRLAEGLAEIERRLPVVTEARSFGLLGGLDIAVANEQELSTSLREAGLIVRVLAGKIVLSPPFYHLGRRAREAARDPR